MGVAVLSRDPRGVIELVSLKLLTTPGTPAKVLKKTKGRMSVDDVRRIRSQWSSLEGILASVGTVHVVGAEYYTVGAGGPSSGGAWKTALSFQSVASFAWANELTLVVSLPMDLKYAFAGDKKAGKVQVMAGLFSIVGGLAEALEQYPAGAHEHLSDAVGHAVLALRQTPV